MHLGIQGAWRRLFVFILILAKNGIENRKINKLTIMFIYIIYNIFFIKKKTHSQTKYSLKYVLFLF